MTFVVRSADERRREIQEAATRMGIDDAYISELVETFYETIRADEQLGPIFEAKIGDNWASHLAKMKDFWSSVAMNSGRYNGKPVVVHNKLSNVTGDNFQTWLTLFRQTLDATAPTPEAIPYFMERAERIAESLQLSMFGYPGIKKEVG